LATAYEWHAAGPTTPRLAITNNLASRFLLLLIFRLAFALE
jgi:hypothetical protein